MITVAFDIDDTLWKVIDEGPASITPVLVRGVIVPVESEHRKYHQSPDYDMIQLLRWYQKNGDRVIVWSAGGIEYAENFVNKFGLREDGPIKVIEKKQYPSGTVQGLKIFTIDICYDDQIVNLAKVNIRVRR